MKRTLFLALAVVAAALPISPAAAMAVAGKPTVKRPTRPAPHSAAKARKVLVADVKKLGRAFAHEQYRSVCSDLTTREWRTLGGQKPCLRRMQQLNSPTLVKRFTVVRATLDRRRTRAAVSVRINGSKQRVLKGVFKWEGGKYRLDHQTGA